MIKERLIFTMSAIPFLKFAAENGRKKIQGFWLKGL
jgi:hypothetical protein